MSSLFLSVAVATKPPAAIDPSLCSLSPRPPYPPWALPFPNWWGMRIKVQILSQIHAEMVPCERDSQVAKRLFPVTRPQIKSWSTHKYLQCPHHKVRNQALARSGWLGWGIKEKSNTQHSPLNQPNGHNQPKDNITSHAVRTYTVEDGEAMMVIGVSTSSLKWAKGPEENNVTRQRRKSRKSLVPKARAPCFRPKNGKRKWYTGEGGNAGNAS